jgi:hypothetical protein
LIVLQNRTFIHLLRNTWYFTFLLFVINLVAVYVSLDSFIRPLERVAQQLKKNKKVRVADIKLLTITCLSIS